MFFSSFRFCFRVVNAGVRERFFRPVRFNQGRFVPREHDCFFQNVDGILREFGRFRGDRPFKARRNLRGDGAFARFLRDHFVFLIKLVFVHLQTGTFFFRRAGHHVLLHFLRLPDSFLLRPRFDAFLLVGHGQRNARQNQSRKENDDQRGRDCQRNV